MSWAVGFDERWNRDIGYGVPASCDHPGCDEEIDRGLSHVCGGEVYGGDHGCGLFFCDAHRDFGVRGRGEHSVVVALCQRCQRRRTPFEPKPDVAEWTHHKATDESWAGWRADQVCGGQS